VVAFHTAASSPTVACVVSVTRAFARGGLLALRLLADFVVTEAMVACASQGGGAGSLCSSYGTRAGGQLSRGSRGAVAVVAGEAWSRGGPEEFGRCHSAARRVCQAC
jgi:hypothetical protein